MGIFTIFRKKGPEQQQMPPGYFKGYHDGINRIKPAEREQPNAQSK